MDSKKLKERKYPSALKLAQGEKKELPAMYESGKSVKDIAEHYSTSASTIIKALVFLGFSGPSWAVDAVTRTLKKQDITPSTMKRVTEPLI